MLPFMLGSSGQHGGRSQDSFSSTTSDMADFQIEVGAFETVYENRVVAVETAQELLAGSCK